MELIVGEERIMLLCLGDHGWLCEAASSAGLFNGRISSQGHSWPRLEVCIFYRWV